MIPIKPLNSTRYEGASAPLTGVRAIVYSLFSLSVNSEVNKNLPTIALPRGFALICSEKLFPVIYFTVD